MPAYKERFPEGTLVRVAAKNVLEAFKRDWKYHHPLAEEQIEFAGREDMVKSVGFYHGGDVLYWLEQFPGTWHECCLEEISN
jgi:hypothetical protein